MTVVLEYIVNIFNFDWSQSPSIKHGYIMMVDVELSSLFLPLAIYNMQDKWKKIDLLLYAVFVTLHNSKKYPEIEWISPEFQWNTVTVIRNSK